MNIRFYSMLCGFWLLSCFSFPLFSQIEMKLQWMPGIDSWGVYVKPVGVTPSDVTITGSGQVTIVAPFDFKYANLQNHAGLWAEDAVIGGPPENFGKKYISFGMLQAEPTYPIPLVAGEETLLFAFELNGPCPDTLYLIDCGTPNETDSFCAPNSENSNPHNDLSVIDFGNGTAFYNFTDIYGNSSWNCHGDVPDSPSPTSEIDGNQEEALDMALSPNPAHGVIFIKIKNELPAGKSNLLLLDMNGRLLKKTKFENDAQRLGLSGLPAGMYLLALEKEGRVLLRKKFVKY